MKESKFKNYDCARSARRKLIITCIFNAFPTPNVGLGRWRLTSATSAELTNHDCARSVRRKWIIHLYLLHFRHEMSVWSVTIDIGNIRQAYESWLRAKLRAKMTNYMPQQGPQTVLVRGGWQAGSPEATKWSGEGCGRGIRHGWDFLKESCSKVAFWEHF